MNFFQICYILWSRRALIAGCAAACFLAACAVSLVLPTRYAAYTRVMLDVVKPDPVTGQMINTTFARAYTRTQAELITDFGVADRAVQLMGWADNPTFRQAYDNANSQLDYRHWLAQIVINGTQANLIEGTNILNISYTTDSQDHARTVADAIRTAYIEQNIVLRRQVAARNAHWFEQQAAKVRGQLEEAQKKKNAYEKANNVVLTDDYKDPETARLQAVAGSAPLPVGSAAVPVSSPAANQLATIDAQIVAQSRALGPNHPDLLTLRRQREMLAAQVAQDRSAATAASRASGGGGVSIASQQAKVIASRDKIDVLRGMQAQIDALRDLYSKTMVRANDLKQEADSLESGITPMGTAVAPDKPVSPNLPLILLGSLVAGIGLGLLTALLLELLNRRVRGIDDLRSVSVPFLGVIGGSTAAPSRQRLPSAAEDTAQPA